MSSDPRSDDPTPAAERGAPLLEALERHSQSARDHAESTAAYAFATAAELGLARDDCQLVREAARLHEVGQVYGEAGSLGTSQEQTYRLARGAGIDEEVCRWLLRTRERFDGGGPESMAGDAIPIQARLIRATCTFHAALVEPPPDSDAPAHVTAIEQIRSQSGAELDPAVVTALVAVLERATTSTP